MAGSCEDRSPPLRVVLGAFSDAKSDVATAAAPGGETVPLQSAAAPAATYILGTSYFASPRLGASAPVGSSSSSFSGRRSALGLNKDGRVPMEDRKGAFDHYKPKSLVLSTVRVTAINISTTLSHFFSDQLHNEQTLDSMIETGEITQREADKRNEEWENREWQQRIDAMPKKIGLALLRYHACTAMMRFYEFVMARYILHVDGPTGMIEGSGSGTAVASSIVSHEQGIDLMDKLTRDPFQASKRTSQLVHASEHAPGKVISSDGTETSTSRELTKTMFTTCLWSNIIPFLAELTVQQGVLIYGYGVYYVAKQKRLKKKREMEEQQQSSDEGKDTQCIEKGDKDEDDINETAYALSIMFRSSRLITARTMSWIVASAGGALGCVIYPGWGTVFGIQIGDSVVGALID